MIEPEKKPASSWRKKVGTEAVKHPIITAGFAALIGGVVGWFIGSWSTCARSGNGCRIDVGALEAAGTWFGAIGTILAVLAAIASLQSNEQVRRDGLEADERSFRSRQERMFASARAVNVIAHPLKDYQGNTALLDFWVHNGSPDTVTSVKLTLNHPDLGQRTILTLGGIAPGVKTERKRMTLGEAIRTPDDFTETMTVLNFEIDGVRWQRHGRQAPARMTEGDIHDA